MGPPRSHSGRASPRHRWLRRIWAAAWLPLLLVGLAVVLEPAVNEFALGLVLLTVALATAWLRDAVRATRRRHRGVGSHASGHGTRPPDGPPPE